MLNKDKSFQFYESRLLVSNNLKEKLVIAPIITPPDWTLEFELMYDTSDLQYVKSHDKERLKCSMLYIMQ